MFMPEERFELSQACAYSALNAACLPISPLRHKHGWVNLARMAETIQSGGSTSLPPHSFDTDASGVEKRNLNI